VFFIIRGILFFLAYFGDTIMGYIQSLILLNRLITTRQPAQQKNIQYKTLLRAHFTCHIF